MNYRLTWKFEIVATDPGISVTVYVNSNTGVIEKSFQNGKSNGPAILLYDGTQTIDTRWVGGIFHGHHHLHTDDNDKNIETKRGPYINLPPYNTFHHPIKHWNKINDIFDLDDNWAADQDLNTSAHWAVSQSWDYFKNIHYRNGIDNANRKLRIWAGSPLGGASYRTLGENARYFEFGPLGTSGLNSATLDVAGHEFTHGVIEFSANLNHDGEPGAIAESFCDIFGNMVEKYGRGTNNWTVGEDASTLRDMQTPSNFGDPSTYLTDPLWVNVVGCIPGGANDPGDNCMVHTNAGVQNHWFYLLSEGGTQNGVIVQGIGASKAARIAYNNLRFHLGSTSGYPASRLGSIASALELFGICSNEVIQTTNAWAAVGVGAPYSGSCLTLSGERIICTDFTTFPYHYSAIDLPGATFIWTFPSSWTGILSGLGNKNLSITGLGSYNPPGGFPATAVIGVTSSLGGSAQIFVTVHNGGNVCEGICGHGGGERGLEKQRVEKELEKVVISPNPATYKITILHPETTVGLINIYSSLGSKVLEVTPTGSSSIIDISKLANGTYLVSITLGSETITKRFVKAN